MSTYLYYFKVYFFTRVSWILCFIHVLIFKPLQLIMWCEIKTKLYRCSHTFWSYWSLVDCFKGIKCDMLTYWTHFIYFSQTWVQPMPSSGETPCVTKNACGVSYQSYHHVQDGKHAICVDDSVWFAGWVVNLLEHLVFHESKTKS